MGTRSLTVFQEVEGEEIAVMYRQFDGYLKGHGQELVDFLKGMQIVNGLRGGGPVANGMGCLAAQVIAHFKTEAGGVYLHKPGTRDAGEEYIYLLSPMKHVDKPGEAVKIRLRIAIGCTTFFGLPGTKEANMPTIFDGPVDTFNADQVEKAEEEANAKGIPNDYINSKQNAG